MSGQSNKNVSSFKAEYYQFKYTAIQTATTRKDFYKIWLINNEGILEYADHRVHIKRPALVFFNPLIHYGFKSIAKERTGYWCIFNEEFLTQAHSGSLKESPLFKSDAAPILFPNKTQLQKIRFLFKEIVNDFNSSYINKYESLRNQVELLIHEGIKIQPLSVTKTRNNAATRLTTHFLNLLEKQYPISSPKDRIKFKRPGDFAGELAVHINHLNAVVQQTTGKSTSELIAQRMIGEGKALLMHSDLSVADIAFSLGFEYPNHFTSFFKKHTGVTPLSLRK